MTPRSSLTRRQWLSAFGVCVAAPVAGLGQTAAGKVQTVLGPVDAGGLGLTLMHEHIVTDLRAPAERRPSDYGRDAAIRTCLPYLEALKNAGCNTLVEPTPIFIGRDPVALRELARQTGLHIVCATGIYGAAGQKFIPDYARRESAEQLAVRYIREIHDGAGGGVRAGIIKTGVNRDTPLPEIERKLVRAAALAGKQTGVTVASHTGPAAPALEELEIIAAAGLPPARFIWVHAQNEKDHEMHKRLAREGIWVEFDGVRPQSADWHLECVRSMAEAGLLERTLISQDAGWYRPGEADQSRYRPYTFLIEEFVPRLQAAGFGGEEIEQLLKRNPARALSGAG